MNKKHPAAIEVDQAMLNLQKSAALVGKEIKLIIKNLLEVFPAKVTVEEDK